MKAPSSPFCYWSVAIGAPSRKQMNRSIQSARSAGVFTPFHVLADDTITDCECYDATDASIEESLRPLVYLKAGISRLPFKHYIWINPTTVFHRLPRDPLQALGSAPIHVPLFDPGRLGETGLTDRTALLSLMTRSGIPGRPLWGSSSFWIIHREAIDLVTETAIQFWQKAKETTPEPLLDVALAYTMQLFCGDPQQHLWKTRPDLWQPTNDCPLPEGSVEDQPAITSGI